MTGLNGKVANLPDDYRKALIARHLLAGSDGPTVAPLVCSAL
jgi:hypothetical protein